jgi:DNA excision repair protein ERCC-4
LPNQPERTGYVSQLTQLTLSFPALSLLWSKSPRATVDMFRELKRNQPEPDGALAQAKEAATDALVKRNNAVALDVLKQLPGVTSENLQALALGGRSLARIATMSADELAPLMGATNAKVLREYLYRPLHMVED